MDIKTLVRERRTIHQFKPGLKPDDDTIRSAIGQSIWAPNHYLTQPWRFYLLGDDSKNRICLLNAELVDEKQGERAALLKFRRWREIPGWLALSCRSADDDLTRREDYASCCCVAQNLMLILWAAGIGMKWTTGEVIRTPAFYEIIGAERSKEEMVGLFWYGFPAEVPRAGRKPPEQVLTQIP